MSAGGRARAHPIGVAALLMGSVLAMATDPVVDDLTVYIDTPPREGAFTVAPGVPGGAAIQLTLACATPAEPGAALPIYDPPSVAIDLALTPTGDGPDTAARTFVTARLVVNDVAAGEDEAFLDAAAEWMRLGAAAGAGCTVGAPCVATINVAVEADAPVDVAWTAHAAAQVVEGPGNVCQLFLEPTRP